MYQPSIDFNKISKALETSMEVLKQDHTVSEPALNELEAAEENFRQAWSFNLSSQIK